MENNTETQQMKTANLTLEDQLLKAGVNKFSCDVASCKGVILEAMETYATQQTADLTAQLQKAEQDKEAILNLLKDLHTAFHKVDTDTLKKIYDKYTNFGITA